MTSKTPIKIKINRNIEVHPEGIYESKVVKSGNGAVITFFKRYIGKEVLIIVKHFMKKGGK